MVVAEGGLDTQPYTYTFDDGATIEVCTDPQGSWHAGVSATVWDSSLVLAKYLEKRWAASLSGDEGVLEQLLQRKQLQVLELGAGCSALPSLVLSHLLSSSGRKDQQITISDKGNALALLHRTIVSARQVDRVRVMKLDWTHHENVSPTNWDIILMADVLAFRDLYEPLIKTISHLANGRTLVFLAYERRDFPEEIEFFRSWGASFKFELIPETDLHEEWRAPGEIYLYRGMKR